MPTVNIENDFYRIDGLVSRSIEPPPGVNAPTVSALSLRRAVSVREALASGGSYQTSDSVFHFPKRYEDSIIGDGQFAGTLQTAAPYADLVWAVGPFAPYLATAANGVVTLPWGGQLSQTFTATPGKAYILTFNVLAIAGKYGVRIYEHDDFDLLDAVRAELKQGQNVVPFVANGTAMTIIFYTIDGGSGQSVQIADVTTGRTLPQIGGTIIDDDGTRWTILEAHLETLTARWRCVCRKNAIASSLDNLVTIERRRNVKAADGTASPSWYAWRCAVPAKIHSDGTSKEMDSGRQAERLAATIFFAEKFDLDRDCRIVCGSDVYQFISDEGRDSITGFYTVTASRKR